MNSKTFAFNRFNIFQPHQKRKAKEVGSSQKRAILWSAQEQTHLAVKKSTSFIKSKSTVTEVKLRDSQGDTHIHPSDNFSFETSIPLQDERVKTIQALEQTLKDLQDQKQAINITIDVLNHRLEFLLKYKSPK